MIRCHECKFWDMEWDAALREAHRGTVTQKECRGGLPTMHYSVAGQAGLWPFTRAKDGCGQGKPFPVKKSQDAA